MGIIYTGPIIPTPYGQEPGVNPEWLRPHIDRLIMAKDDGDVPYGAIGVWIGVDQGCAVLDFPGLGVRKVDPLCLDEPERLESSLDPDRFEEGYMDGFDAAGEGNKLARKSEGRIPDDYSRGFSIGFKDYQRGVCRVFSHAAYNEVARQALYYGQKLAIRAIQALKAAKPGQDREEDADLWVDFCDDSVDLVIETFDKRWARGPLEVALAAAGYRVKEKLLSPDWRDLPDVWRLAS